MLRKSQAEILDLRIKIAAALNAGMSYKEIQAEYGCSPSTIAKVKAIIEDPDRTLEEDNRANNGRPEDYDPAIREKILRARAETGFGPRLLWALIKREPEKYGLTLYELPSHATISNWINEAGLARKSIGPKDNRAFPLDVPNHEGAITIDGWGPWLLSGTTRVYCVTAQDRHTRLSMALPGDKYLQIEQWIHAIHLASEHLLDGQALDTICTDNGIGMAVSNGWTPQPIRYAMSRGTRIVYIPPGQPWRNGRLENWHWRMESEYWRKKYPKTRKEATEGLLGFINWYNCERPHGSLEWKAPADIATWYKPLTNKSIKLPEYPKLGPQKGTLDAIRLCLNDGRVELFQNEAIRLPSLFGGQFLRLRFHLDPTADTQVGEVIWGSGKGKEPLVVATFNHILDRTHRASDATVFDIRPVDFRELQPETAERFLKQRLDDEQVKNQADRIAKRKRNEKIVRNEQKHA